MKRVRKQNRRAGVPDGSRITPLWNGVTADLLADGGAWIVPHVAALSKREAVCHLEGLVIVCQLLVDRIERGDP